MRWRQAYVTCTTELSFMWHCGDSTYEVRILIRCLFHMDLVKSPGTSASVSLPWLQVQPHACPGLWTVDCGLRRCQTQTQFLLSSWCTPLMNCIPLMMHMINAMYTHLETNILQFCTFTHSSTMNIWAEHAFVSENLSTTNIRESRLHFNTTNKKYEY